MNRAVIRGIVSTWVLLNIFLFTSTLSVAQKSNEIQWMTLEEAEAANQKEPRPILIDLYTDWCGYCKRLDAYTFSNRVIVQYINKHFYPVKFDAENKKSVRFRGVDYAPQAMGKTHQLALALTNGRLSYPTLVYIVKEYVVPVPGYYSPSQLEPFLHFFADGSFETVSWEEYLKQFKGELTL